MRSPSGGEARRRGGTQVGKAPPSPKTTISGLTRGQVFGEDQNRQVPDLPGSAGRCGPPLRRAVSFLGSRLLANHLEHSAPGWARSQITHCAETNSIARAAFAPTPRQSRPTDRGLPEVQLPRPQPRLTGAPFRSTRPELRQAAPWHRTRRLRALGLS